MKKTVLMKTAMIDQILLWFVLFSSSVVIVSTISDEMAARNQIIRLKELADAASLAAMKHYTHIGSDTDLAEENANELLSSSPLGQEVMGMITFSWLPDDVNPTSVVVSINGYQQNNFWSAFIDLDSFTLNVQSSSSSITPTTSINPSTALPIALNGCNSSGFTPGNTISFELGEFSGEEELDYNKLYALTTQCQSSQDSDTSSGGVTTEDTDTSSSGVATSTCTGSTQEELLNQLSGFSVNDEGVLVNSSGVETSSGDGDTNEGDIQSGPVQADLHVLDCTSHGNNIVVKNYIRVEFSDHPSTLFQDTEITEYDVKIIESDSDYVKLQ